MKKKVEVYRVMKNNATLFGRVERQCNGSQPLLHPRTYIDLSLFALEEVYAWPINGYASVCVWGGGGRKLGGKYFCTIMDGNTRLATSWTSL